MVSRLQPSVNCHRNLNDRFVLDLILGRSILAAARTNGWFSCRQAACKTERMQRNPCCERTQHKSGTSGVGSIQSLAAYCAKVRYAARRSQIHSH